MRYAMDMSYTLLANLKTCVKIATICSMVLIYVLDNL